MGKPITFQCAIVISNQSPIGIGVSVRNLDSSVATLFQNNRHQESSFRFKSYCKLRIMELGVRTKKKKCYFEPGP